MYPGKSESRVITTEENPVYVGWIEVAAERQR